MVKAYLVGGAVRDKILGHKSKDLDYAVEAPSFDSMLAWAQERGTVFLSCPQFGTLRAKLGHTTADYALCRTDGQYSDGRRPDTVSPATLADDLARRDFTVNAIALDEERGEYIDPHHGIADCHTRTLRAVGDAHARMSEDPLRLLRAVRFAITKGFTLHTDLVECLHNTTLVERISTSVSTERVREELHRCFVYDTMATLEILAEFRALRHAALGNGTKLYLLPTLKARQ